jgi:alpha-L-fucosidase
MNATASHYKLEQKLAMIQVTVHPLCELWQVKNTILLLKQANKGKDLIYDVDVQLLSHTASDYDNVQIKVKGKRQVYLHGINEDMYIEDTYDTCDETPSEPFDIDTPVKTIQAYALNYHPKPNRSDNSNQVQMPRDR